MRAWLWVGSYPMGKDGGAADEDGIRIRDMLKQLLGSHCQIKPSHVQGQLVSGDGYFGPGPGMIWFSNVLSCKAPSIERKWGIESCLEPSRPSTARCTVDQTCTAVLYRIQQSVHARCVHRAKVSHFANLAGGVSGHGLESEATPVVQFAFVRDPAGYTFELMEASEAATCHLTKVIPPKGPCVIPIMCVHLPILLARSTPASRPRPHFHVSFILSSFAEPTMPCHMYVHPLCAGTARKRY